MKLSGAKLKFRLAEEDPDLLFLDGVDNALIGLMHRFGMEPVALYNRQKVIDILMYDFSQGKENVTDDEDGELDLWQMAEEHFEFNIIGAWVGDRTPAFAIMDISAEQ